MIRTLRRTFFWLVLLLVVSGAAAGGFVYWKIARVDDEIRVRLLAELAEKVPDWVVTVDRVHFDWNRTIHVYGFTVRPRGDTEDVASIPEVRMTIDREKYDRSEVVEVQRLHALEPNVLFARDAEGGWNWQRLLPPPTPERSSLPEWVVDDANVRVRFHHTDQAATELPTAVVTGRVVPSGKRRFRVTGDIDMDGTGTFDLDGELDVDRNQWSFSGRARDLVSGERLVEVATRALPETRTRLAELDAKLQGWLPDTHRPGGPNHRPVQVADAGEEGTLVIPVGRTERPTRIAPTTLGIDGRLALEFRLEQPGPDADIEFSVRAEFDGAKLDHPALPFPLHDVDGRVVWGNRRFVVEGFRARNGVTRLEAAGAVEQTDEHATGSFQLSMVDVVLDDRLRSRLTGRLRQVYDTLDPTGRADFSTRIVVDEQGTRTEDLVLETRGAEGAYVGFPYRFERITGGVRQTGRDLAISVDGFAGKVPVQVRGRVVDFTGTNEASFTITGAALPIDEQFLQACRPQIRGALRAMRISGETDFELFCRRPPGIDTAWRTKVEAKLKRAAIECTAFPYRCRNLTGTITFDSAEGTWRFADLAGEHDDARLTGVGRFDKSSPDDPGRLRLRVVARDATFDRQLRLALPESLRRTWTLLDPGGSLDAAIEVDWVPGGAIDFRLPAIQVTNGSLRPEVLPLPLTDVAMKASYANGRLTVERFRAKRNQTSLRAKGFFLLEGDDRWRLRMDDLFVDDLDPDAELRAALPETIRDVVETLDPRGNVSFSGRIEFRGNLGADETVTSAWELETVLPGTTIAAGVDLENVHGSVTSKGTYDGRQVVAEGRMECDSLVLLGYQLVQVKGPYEIEGDRVQLGSRKAFLETVPPIALDERLTARAIDGLLVLDGLVVTGEQPAYNLKALLSNGRLESYARRYMPAATDLAGVMNGWLELHGRGTNADDMQGRGQLQISPAALYELPVVLKLLTAVPFAKKRSAFDHALLEFRIAHSRFQFDAINLSGDALTLRGRGTVGFDSTVSLDFYSQSPRTPLAIPVVRNIVGEAARGLVAVYVRGTLERPQTEVVTAPTIDNALKSFLGPLSQPGPPPSPGNRPNGRR